MRLTSSPATQRIAFVGEAKGSIRRWEDRTPPSSIGRHAFAGYAAAQFENYPFALRQQLSRFQARDKSQSERRVSLTRYVIPEHGTLPTFVPILDVLRQKTTHISQIDG